MNSYLFAWLFLNIFFGVNVSLFTKCQKHTCVWTAAASPQCCVSIKCYMVISKHVHHLRQEDLNWITQSTVASLDRSHLCVYGLHSNFTLEAMVIMILKNPRSNQLSSVLGVCGPWEQWLIFPSDCRKLMKYVMSYKCFHYERHHLFLHFPGVSKWFTGLWEPSTALIRNPVVTLS